MKRPLVRNIPRLDVLQHENESGMFQSGAPVNLNDSLKGFPEQEASFNLDKLKKMFSGNGFKTIKCLADLLRIYSAWGDRRASRLIVKGFLKSGAFHETDKPVWFDVWEAFPPAVPPSLDRPVQKTEVPEILYPEDAVRAKFLSIYERPLTNIKNENPWKNIKAEVFVNEYIKRQSPDKTADEVTRETIAALQTRDIHFPLKGGRKYGEEDTEQTEMLDTSGRPVIKRSRPKFSIDFSDLLPGELPREITPPSKTDDAIISDIKQRVDSEDVDAEILARVQAKIEARRRVSNAEEMDSVIEDLLDEPETRKIKFEDFYGKDDVDFEFEDELTDSDSSEGGVDREKK